MAQANKPVRNKIDCCPPVDLVILFGVILYKIYSFWIHILFDSSVTVTFCLDTTFVLGLYLSPLGTR